MIDTTILLPYLLACLLFTVVPGPGVTVVVANSLAGGTRAGVLTVLGTQLSMVTMVLIVALGLEAVVTLVSEAFTVIKFAGAAYLVWIGWKMFTSSGRLALGEAAPRVAPWRYVWQAAVINWSNPKTLLFLGAFLPQFVDMNRPAFGQIVILGLIVMAVATVTDLVYVVIAGRARAALTAARVRMMNRVSGVILMAGGVWIAFQKRA